MADREGQEREKVEEVRETYLLSRYRRRSMGDRVSVLVGQQDHVVGEVELDLG